MDSKVSKNYSFLSTSSDDSILILIPCEYDPDEGYDSLSEDSIDSSELVDSSDDELATIKINEIRKINV